MARAAKAREPRGRWLLCLLCAQDPASAALLLTSHTPAQAPGRLGSATRNPSIQESPRAASPTPNPAGVARDECGHLSQSSRRIYSREEKKANQMPGTAEAARKEPISCEYRTGAEQRGVSNLLGSARSRLVLSLRWALPGKCGLDVEGLLLGGVKGKHGLGVPARTAKRRVKPGV